MARKVMRIGWSNYAPEISDGDALALIAERCDNAEADALVLRFHSDVKLADRRQSDRQNAEQWLYGTHYAYNTNNFGPLDGMLYVIPCMNSGRKDAWERTIFIGMDGKEFAVDYQAGCPECPTRVFLVDPMQA